MLTSPDWSTFKTFITNYSIPIQWLDLGNLYYLKAYQDKFEVEYYIVKSTPAGSDQTDFETNYKTSGNQPIKSNIVQVLGKDSLSLNPFGAYSGTAIQANTTSSWDIEIPYTAVLRGGVLFSQNAVIGDYFNISIIDKNNVLGYGGTSDNPTVLGEYVQQWYVMPGVINQVEDISISQSLPQGVFVRVTYVSTGPIAPSVVINFISYQTITS